MWTILALIAAQGATAATARAPVASIAGQRVYADPQHNIVVEFVQSPEGITVFTGRMPAGWTFDISVDGNQDGAWGVGKGIPSRSITISPDRKFGQASRTGVFCSQYVFTSVEGDPTQIYSSSGCGELPSDGQVIMSGFDSAMRAKLTYQIPAPELFGTAATVRVQACVWDTVRWSCQHSMPTLLELKRLPAAGAERAP